ncbi:Frizzled/Smoothened family membrane region containing protein [Aphelenchoides bicaudatus]|nr:Frizzled/Smoothened family membrane region containing protein [Aphelenchoides bicaudatus]
MGTFALLFLFLVFAQHQLAYSKKQCEPITIPLCKGIGYNQTSFPNRYGHERQEEAGLEVHQFFPLVEVACYKHLKFFLCTMYTPICQENYELSIMPCQEVCIEAKKNCAPLMNSHGFKWPETLDCEQLPKFSDQQTTGTLCAAPPDTLQASPVDESPKPDLNKNRINNGDWDSSETRNGMPSRINDDNQCKCQCTAPFRLVSNENTAISTQIYRIQNVSNCAYSCDGLLMAPTKNERLFMQKWMLILASTCFGVSLFTVITFCLDMARFTYPERPILFLAFCQCAVSLGFIIQLVQGDGAKVGCDGDILRTSTNLLIGSASKLSCLGVFVLIYYFGMAAAVWWMVLCLSWVLAAVPHWSSEWIAKKSFYFHLFSWLLPAVQTVLAYLFGAIDGDPITGVCYIGNTNATNLLFFVIAPTTLYFLTGLLFLFSGLRNLWSIRSNLKKSHPRVDRTSKLTQLMSKIGCFSFIYTASVILHLGLLLIEYIYRPEWEKSYLCSCSNVEVPTNETLYIMSLLKTASMLVVGYISIVWILSPKTLQSWKRLFCMGSSPYATYAASSPFGDHVVGPQYSKIPQPPNFPPPSIKQHQFPSPVIDIYKHDIMNSPMTYKSGGTLRHGGFYPENV